MYSPDYETSVPSAPGWTMTPLYQECERVKETCARLALENAALTAHNVKLTAAVTELRKDAATINTRVDEAEALRERDVHHLKAAVERLETALVNQGKDFRAELAAQASEFLTQLTGANAAHGEARGVMRGQIEARLVQMTSQEAELRGVERELAAGARQELWTRTEAAQSILRDEEVRRCGELNAAIERAEAESAAAVASARADTARLRASTDERSAALEAVINERAGDVQRALETKLASVHSALLRLDRQSRDQGRVLEESREEASSRSRDAAEEVSAVESRITGVESRLILVEREAAAAARGMASPGTDAF